MINVNSESDANSGGSTSIKPISWCRRMSRVSIRTILILSAVFAVVLAVETNRVRNQEAIVRQLDEDAWYCETRYGWLESEWIPDKCRDWANEALGDHWNSDITSITLWRMDNQELIQRTTRLPKLSILSIHNTKLKKENIDWFCRMHSLQWLNLIGTDLDEETLKRLRRQLPNTFVTQID